MLQTSFSSSRAFTTVPRFLLSSGEAFNAVLRRFLHQSQCSTRRRRRLEQASAPASGGPKLSELETLRKGCSGQLNIRVDGIRRK